MTTVALYVAIVLVTLVALLSILWPVVLLLWLVLIVRRYLNRKARYDVSR